MVPSKKKAVKRAGKQPPPARPCKGHMKTCSVSGLCIRNNVAPAAAAANHHGVDPVLLCPPHALGWGGPKVEPIGRYFYRCRWPECGELSPKEDWGPGRITCPACKRTAMSAAESHTVGVCPGCGGRAWTDGTTQLLCDKCASEVDEARRKSIAFAYPFTGWTFCDQCQSDHAPAAHLFTP